MGGACLPIVYWRVVSVTGLARRQTMLLSPALILLSSGVRRQYVESRPLTTKRGGLVLLPAIKLTSVCKRLYESPRFEAPLFGLLNRMWR